MLIEPNILIIDDGDPKLAKKIARVIRALGVFTLIEPSFKALNAIDAFKPKAKILVRGENSSAEIDADIIFTENKVTTSNGCNSACSNIDNVNFIWPCPEADFPYILQLESFLSHNNIERTYTPEFLLQTLLEEIKNTVKNEKILIALSGGVDSSVCAALLHKATQNQLEAVFVDHGLLRQNEALEVVEAFKGKIGLNLSPVDASNKFLTALAGVIDPEEKRKIIGRLFIEIFEEESLKYQDLAYLAQGTIYPDIIESNPSTSGGAAVKSHHNVGGLPDRLKLKLIEPLKYLFKDEVRVLGTLLGLSADLVYRQPFPGPGLGVRCIGEVTREKLLLLRQADAIMREEFKNNLHDKLPWQYFAALLPTKSVGVVQGNRTYGYSCVLRAVETSDAMEASPSNLDFALLSKIAERILNEVQGITRVLYDLSPKPPATIEWE